MASFPDNQGKQHQKGKTILDFTEAINDAVAVASAGPYANHLHLAPERWPRQHLITQAGCPSCCQTNRVKALKDLNLKPVMRQWCPAAGKVTVGLVSYWLWFTDLSGLSIGTLNDYVKEMSNQGSPSFVCHQFKDFLSTFSTQIFTVSETGPYTVSLRLQIHKCE